ncbi:MAG: hypothetical protein R3321_13340, partial [Nitrososphaeraceae archaeon]|nr:hypothetical protein [Nitrososphaeraceae archaeon]
MKLIQKEAASIPVEVLIDQNTITLQTGKNRVQESRDNNEELIFNQGYSIPDINPVNDGKFPLDFSFLTGLPDHRDYSLYWLPYIGLNTSDKFLLGLGIHNFEILSKPFEYYVAPAYSFGNNKLAGSYLFKYDWLIADHKISKIRMYAKYNSFSIYDKVNPGISFHLLNNKPYKLSRWFSLDYNLSYINDPLNPLYVDNQFVKAEYFYHKVRAVSKTSIRAALSTGNMIDDPTNNFANVDMNIDQTFVLSKKDIINIGLFAGCYIKEPSQASFYYTSTGMFDYGMNTYLVDRALNNRYNGLGKYQILHDYGHFVAVNELVNDYMLSLKLEYQRTGIPIQAYLTGGVIDNDFYYDAGLSYRL